MGLVVPSGGIECKCSSDLFFDMSCGGRDVRVGRASRAHSLLSQLSMKVQRSVWVLYPDETSSAVCEYGSRKFVMACGEACEVSMFCWCAWREGAGAREL